MLDCTYNLRVRITFDPEKNARNIRERGLSFERASEFEFESAVVREDERREYGEVRYVALGRLGDRLHVLCFRETEEGIPVLTFVRQTSER